jgi:hypothetical protein
MDIHLPLNNGICEKVQRPAALQKDPSTAKYESYVRLGWVAVASEHLLIITNYGNRKRHG